MARKGRSNGRKGAKEQETDEDVMSREHDVCAARRFASFKYSWNVKRREGKAIPRVCAMSCSGRDLEQTLRIDLMEIQHSHETHLAYGAVVESAFVLLLYFT